MSEQAVLFRSNHSFTTVRIAITYSKCIYSVFSCDPSVGMGAQTKLSGLCFASLTANPLTKSDGSVNIYWEIEPSLTDSPNPDSPFGADLLQDKWCVIKPREPVCTRNFLKCKVQPSVSPCICCEFGLHGLMEGMIQMQVIFFTPMNNVCISLPSKFQEGFYHISAQEWHCYEQHRGNRITLAAGVAVGGCSSRFGWKQGGREDALPYT